jgi:hypothetical protein
MIRLCVNHMGIENSCLYWLEFIFLFYIDGHTTQNIMYKWLTNKTETSVLKNELVIPQFDIGKIETTSHVIHYTVGTYHSLYYIPSCFLPVLLQVQ